MADESKERNFNYDQIKRLEQELTHNYTCLMEIHKNLVVTDTDISNSLAGESKTAYITSASAIQERLEAELKKLKLLIKMVARGNEESRDKDIEIGDKFKTLNYYLRSKK
ncbi:hypothetical protein [Lacrimispora indolis]|uniref:hypothetical protein n=1 Tax=Lacrimispora indolis TaxID=69825 RepID=UPI0004169ECA|nr:hypothetical protein [[Clostridium] methoxybenzovorans]